MILPRYTRLREDTVAAIYSQEENGGTSVKILGCVLMVVVAVARVLFLNLEPALIS
jgi:hypothetical protein